MKTLDMLTRKELSREYKISMAFIARHAKDMGGIGKPQIFDRELVERYLREMMTEDSLAQEQNEEKRNELLEYLNRRIAHIGQPQIIGRNITGKILGRGGKGKAA